ncbi:hypothetical protein D9M71_303870 [compost metagenome]
MVDAHLGRDVVEQSRADEEAVLGTRHLEVAAIDNQLRALGHAFIDEAFDFGLVLGGHQRPHVAVALQAVADFQLIDTRQQFGNQLVADIAHCHGNRDRHAALTGRAISRADQGIRCLVEVRIGHDDHVILRPAQGLHAFAAGGGLLVNVFGNRRRTDKGNRFDVRVLQQRIDRRLIALHHVEHSIRQTGFSQQPRHQQTRGRIALGRLEDEAVTGNQRQRDHPQRHHHREVERCNPGTNPQWLAQVPVVDAAADVVAEFGFQQVRRTAGVFDDFDATGDFALGVGKHLAVFAADDFCQFVVMAIEQLLELEHHPRTPQGRLLGPGWKGFQGRCNCRVHGLLAGQPDPCLHAAGGWVKDIAEPLTAGVLHPTVYVMAYNLGVAHRYCSPCR